MSAGKMGGYKSQPRKSRKTYFENYQDSLKELPAKRITQGNWLKRFPTRGPEYSTDAKFRKVGEVIFSPCEFIHIGTGTDADRYLIHDFLYNTPDGKIRFDERLWIAGHLISHSFCGDGTESLNIVPLTRDANKEHIFKLEKKVALYQNAIASYFEQPSVRRYSRFVVSLIYKVWASKHNNGERPEKITGTISYSYAVQKGDSKGGEIDYARFGDSITWTIISAPELHDLISEDCKRIRNEESLSAPRFMGEIQDLKEKIKNTQDTDDSTEWNRRAKEINETYKSDEKEKRRVNKAREIILRMSNESTSEAPEYSEYSEDSEDSDKEWENHKFHRRISPKRKKIYRAAKQEIASGDETLSEKKILLNTLTDLLMKE